MADDLPTCALCLAEIEPGEPFIACRPPNDDGADAAATEEIAAVAATKALAPAPPPCGECGKVATDVYLDAADGGHYCGACWRRCYGAAAPAAARWVPAAAPAAAAAAAAPATPTDKPGNPTAATKNLSVAHFVHADPGGCLAHYLA